MNVISFPCNPLSRCLDLLRAWLQREVNEVRRFPNVHVLAQYQRASSATSSQSTSH